MHYVKGTEKDRGKQRQRHTVFMARRPWWLIKQICRHGSQPKPQRRFKKMKTHFERHFVDLALRSRLIYCRDTDCPLIILGPVIFNQGPKPEACGSRGKAWSLNYTQVVCSCMIQHQNKHRQPTQTHKPQYKLQNDLLFVVPWNKSISPSVLL